MAITDKEELKKLLNQSDWDCPNEKAYRARIRNPQTAIRAFCVICQGGHVASVNDCAKLNCPLYPFREGKNPFTNRKGNPEALLKQNGENQ